MPKIERPRGTRDFGVDQMSRRRAAERIFRDAFEGFGYREVQTPTFESLELFKLKSGPGVEAELYAFKDKGGRELTLRPELTAPVLRFYVNELSREPKPLKLYYFGNCFRYEEPQSGRWREFWQFGTEIIGPSTPEADAETIALAVGTLGDLGVSGDRLRLRVGHVGILRAVLDALPVDGAVRGELYRLVDKKNLEGLRERLERAGEATSPIAKLVVDIASVPHEVRLVEGGFSQDWAAVAGVLAAIRDALGAQSEAGARVAAAGASLEEVARLLSAYGVGRAFVDLGVARGLDYYTGMVFEIEIPELGAEKQVVGGGAYALAELFGGENVGSVGFGMGFDRILLALEKLGVPLPSESGLLATVVPIGDALRGAAIALATELRQSRLRTDVELARRKPAKALEWANARGIPFVILLGEKEAAQGAVTVRSMTTGEQVLVPRKEIVSHMAHLARILRESKSHADARSRPR